MKGAAEQIFDPSLRKELIDELLSNVNVPFVPYGLLKSVADRIVTAFGRRLEAVQTVW